MQRFQPKFLRHRGGVQAYLVPCLLALLAIPALWPFLQYGLLGTADGHLHLLRLVLLDHHMGQGMLYPRWVPELVLGYGYPVFHFYGPSTYYLALLLLHGLALSYVQALITTFGVLIVTAGFGMYLLAIDLFAGQGEQRRRWFALVAAVAYMYTPYLLITVYMRGAIAEVGAQALLPWIFWSFRRLLTAPQPARYLLPATLFLGCLAITHTITLIFAPPVLLLYLLVVWSTNPVTRQALGRHLGWALAGGLTAMGSSCFFWAPLIFERSYLADTAYEISARFIHENVWTWQNFVDWHWPFEYALAVPFQIGAVQLLLALLGFLCLRRRSGEWWYWALLIPLLSIAISRPLLPVWLSSDVLLTAQFPWRLLTIMSVPLALFSPHLLTGLRREALLIGGALLLSGLIVVSNRPQWPTGAEQFPNDVALTLATVAQFELDTGAFGTGSASEYFPTWVNVLDTVIAPTADNVVTGQALTLTAANEYQWQLTVNNSAAGPVHFTRFYFPGWQATLDDNLPLPVEPTTLMGLLTVKLPAGLHKLNMRWQGTTLQWWSALVSLLTLVIVMVNSWRQGGRPRWLALLPLGLLLFGGVATFKPLPQATTFQKPTNVPPLPNMQLLGYYTQQPTPDQLYLFPFWAVDTTPPDLLLHWRLVDGADKLISEITVRPYFNTRHTSSWLSASVAQDAYLLPLPAGLQAGNYTLQVSFEEVDAEEQQAAAAEQRLVTVGQIALDNVPLAARKPMQPLTARWEQDILLDGFDLQVDGQALIGSGVNETMGQGTYLVVKPGSQLNYTFYWRAERTPVENYHGFLHLLDAQQQALVQRDQLPGPIFSPPQLWNRFTPYTDSYVLTIPESATSGLYTPHVGLYHFGNGDRLSTFATDGTPLGSSVALPPVKIVAPLTPTPQHELAIKVGDFAELIGYDLTLPTTPITPGTELTATLYYRATGNTSIDYTQFVHLHDGTLGMAAQNDQMPQQGANPTSSWVPGEVIVDQIRLQIAVDSTPGTYTLQVGLYDGANGAMRVPLFTPEGQGLSDAQLPLTTIVISPCNGHC